MAYEILHYQTPSGRDVYADWFDSLRDVKAKSIISVRIDRIERGLFGDAKSLRDGVYELKIDYGPGYRVYFAHPSRKLVILLCAGNKGTQRSDIDRAVKYWIEYQGRVL